MKPGITISRAGLLTTGSRSPLEGHCFVYLGIKWADWVHEARADLLPSSRRNGIGTLGNVWHAAHTPFTTLTRVHWPTPNDRPTDRSVDRFVPSDNSGAQPSLTHSLPQ